MGSSWEEIRPAFYWEANPALKLDTSMIDAWSSRPHLHAQSLGNGAHLGGRRNQSLVVAREPGTSPTAAVTASPQSPGPVSVSPAPYRVGREVRAVNQEGDEMTFNLWTFPGGLLKRMHGRCA